jgi:hypothetical protein
MSFETDASKVIQMESMGILVKKRCTAWATDLRQTGHHGYNCAVQRIGITVVR